MPLNHNSATSPQKSTALRLRVDVIPARMLAMQPRLDILGVLLLTLLRLCQNSLVLLLAHQLGEVSDLLLCIIDSLDGGFIQRLGYRLSVCGKSRAGART